MKQEPGYFKDKEPVLVYIAKKLNDALALEGIFDAAGVDYGVEADEYHGGVVFHTVRIGAFFYVLPAAATAAREVMQRNGYTPHVEPGPPV
ncbi:MAG: hypothetical protein ABSC23_04720 [Bryobacteraceae bacterium]|jgi:hypothetical protein